jgi:hypothetical protein
MFACVRGQIGQLAVENDFLSQWLKTGYFAKANSPG